MKGDIDGDVTWLSPRPFPHEPHNQRAKLIILTSRNGGLKKGALISGSRLAVLDVQRVTFLFGNAFYSAHWQKETGFRGALFRPRELIAMYLRAVEASKYKKQSTTVLAGARKKLSGLVA